MNAVSLIGSGNVAWHLAHAFHQHGVKIEWIWNRHPYHAETLASEVKAQATSNLADLAQSKGCIFICVPDHVIPEIVHQAIVAGLQDHIICHTSGATPLDVFPESISRSGVFYPLQTLTRGHPVEFTHLPILLSTNNPFIRKDLMELAGRISQRVEVINDQERRHIHLAAVMVNNFVFHLCDRAFRQVESRGLDASLLYPLLEETTRKIKAFRKEGVQTGPAIRNDINSLYAHLALLAEDPDLAALYRHISKSINPELEI